MPTGFTSITATKIQDASGHPLAAGIITFRLCSSTGEPISAISGGTGGGMIVAKTVSYPVLNGAIQNDSYGNPPQLQDCTLTTPSVLAYDVNIFDEASGEDDIQGPGFHLIQPSGSTWSLDTNPPINPATSLTIQAGPPGLSAYAQAVLNGFSGSLSAWLASLAGTNGQSAYQLAVANGYSGSLTAWLASLVGPTGSLSSFNGYSFLYAANDPFGRAFAFGVDSQGNGGIIVMQTGEIIVSGSSIGLANCVDAEGNSYFVTRVIGKQQIFRLTPAGVLTQLTFSGNNVLPQLAADGAHICFITDRTGSWQPYWMTTVGVSQLPAGETIFTQFNRWAIPSGGQSTAIGLYGYPALSSSATYAQNTMPVASAGTGTGPIQAGATAWSSETPLIEDGNPGTDASETHCSGLANTLTHLGIVQDQRSITSVSATMGEAGYTIGALEGTQAGMAAFLTAMLGIETTAGKVLGCLGVPWIQGESDEAASTANYVAALLTFQASIASAFAASFPTIDTFPMFIAQLASSFQNSDGSSVIVPQQNSACALYPNKFVMTGPSYTDEAVAYPHFTNAGYRRKGERIAKVMKLWWQGKWKHALQIRSAILVGNTITVRYWVPSGPLQFDPSGHVTDPMYGGVNSKGFQFFDGASALTASYSIVANGVTIIAPDTVQIVLAGTPTGPNPRITYAWTTPSPGSGLGGPVGPTVGARGVLCDSDSTPSLYGNVMTNYAIIESFALSSL